MEKNTNDKVKELTEGLDRGLQEAIQSDEFKRYLSTMAKFHNYSVNNCLLIAMQCPDATRVAGISTWNRMGRHVRKGETGIKIISPAPYKTFRLQNRTDSNTGAVVFGPDGNPIQDKVEVMIPNYKISVVFDLSQTEGKELPEIVHELKGSPKEFDDLFLSLQTISPVPFSFESISSGAKGYYSTSEHKIVINTGMERIQTLKTAIHELAHAILHDRYNGTFKDKPIDASTKEVQAESVAYVVCNYFGLDTSTYSFGYIAGWAKDKELTELKDSMGIIRTTSADIINGIEREMERLQTKRDTLDLASEIGGIAREFNIKGYDDVVICEAAMLDSLIKDLSKGNVDYMQKWMDTAISKSSSAEEVNRIKEAKEQIKKYEKPLKVSEPIPTQCKSIKR